MNKGREITNMTSKNNSLKSRNIDFGFNYIPTIALVEDFRPYWIENKCTFEQMKRDLLCMRALNSRFVRFHLMPANPKQRCDPGIDPDKFQKDIKKAVHFAYGIGLSIHYDIFKLNILEITPDEVRNIVQEYKGIIDSYQIGNEPYFDWSKSDEYYEHAYKLIKAGKEADPDAKFSVDIFPADLEYMRQKYPQLYDMLDMTLIHYYSVTDHRGWSPLYIEQLVYFCSGESEKFDNLKNEKFIQSEFYEGSYGYSDFDFKKEKWITEITAGGYHRFSTVVPDEIKVNNWKDVCSAIINRTDVTRVGHHCFRDKMSWREFGTSQCGVVNIDGSPKPLAFAFKEIAAATLPDTDLSKWVKVNLSVESRWDPKTDSDDILKVDSQAKSNNELRTDSWADNYLLTISLQNYLDREVQGNLELEVSDGITFEEFPKILILKAMEETVIKVRLKRFSNTKNAATQIFAIFSAKNWKTRDNTSVGWYTLKKEKPITLNVTDKAFDGVKYLDDMKSVANFFKRYPNPVILTGGLIGFDTEMAFRLKSVIQARSGREIKLVSMLNVADVLDQPIIIIGNPQKNYIAGILEQMVDEKYKVSKDNKSFIAAITDPFKYKKRISDATNAIGFAGTPACLYIAGMNDDDLKAAVYDLIRRVYC